jgi:hypothetical protein
MMSVSGMYHWRECPHHDIRRSTFSSVTGDELSPKRETPFYFSSSVLQEKLVGGAQEEN